MKSSSISSLPDTQLQDAADSIHQPEKFQMFLHRDIHMNSIVMLLGCATKDENHTRLIALHLIKTLNDDYGNDVRVWEITMKAYLISMFLMRKPSKCWITTEFFPNPIS